jgi:alpha-1,3/alpha-1,6-mannosyltransferase
MCHIILISLFRSGTRTVAFIHPDLGIGGAERLVVDAAIGMQALGHSVVMYTSHHDPRHCFEETRNGKLEVKVSILNSSSLH